LLEVNERVVEIGFPGGIGIFGGFWSADGELNCGFGDLASLLCSAIVNADLGGEFHGAFRNAELDGGLGVGAKGVGVGLTIDGESLAANGLVDLKIAPGLLGVGDVLFGDGNFFAVLGVEGGIDPSGPVVRFVAEIVDVKF